MNIDSVIFDLNTKIQLNKRYFLLSFLMITGITLYFGSELSIESLKKMRRECMMADAVAARSNIDRLNLYLVMHESDYARNARSTCNLVLNNYKESIDDITYRIEHNKNKYTKELYLLYWERGATYQKYGMLNEAVTDLTVSLEKDDSYSPIYINRADVLVLLGRYEDALKDYENSLKILKIHRRCNLDDCAGRSVAYPESSVYVAALNIYKHFGEKDKFDSTLKEALSRNPGSEELRSISWDLKEAPIKGVF